MNAGKDDEGIPEGDDIAAAEYVLGVQPAAERAAVALRVDSEADFARLVERWEERLSPLAADYPVVEPPASVREALGHRLFGGRTETSRPGLWTSLAFWRGLTVAALAALAVAVAVPLMETPSAPVPLVAALAAEGSDVHYVAVYDPSHGDVGLSHVSGARGEHKDFQLWMIVGKDAPISLGVIPVGSSIRITMPPAMQGHVAEGIVFAISMEPAGGSTTGAPTGPVVAAGDLRSI